MPEYNRRRKYKTKKSAANLANKIIKNKNQFLKGTKYNKKTKLYTVSYSEFIPKKPKKMKKRANRWYYDYR